MLGPRQPRWRNGELGAALVATHLITPLELRTAERWVRQHGFSPDRLGSALVEFGYLSESILIQTQSRLFGIAVGSFDLTTIDQNTLGFVPATFARQHRFVPCQRDAGVLSVAVAAPLRDDVFMELAAITSSQISAFLVSDRELDAALRKFYPDNAAVVATDGRSQALTRPSPAADSAGSCETPSTPQDTERTAMQRRRRQTTRRRRRAARTITYRFPYRCTSVPRFETAERGERFVRDYTSEGHFKACAHLAVIPSTLSTYSPWCKQGAFDSRRGAEGTVVFHGCPARCPSLVRRPKTSGGNLIGVRPLIAMAIGLMAVAVVVVLHLA